MITCKIRFDGWVLDPESGDLERAGVRTRLQEQPVLLLKELIAQPGEVVTREQLMGVLWPKGVVDFDTGLNTAVRKLRNALGDAADTPRYIETLPRRGYRFIAALDPELDPPQGPRAQLAGPSGPKPGPQPSATPPSGASVALAADGCTPSESEVAHGAQTRRPYLAGAVILTLAVFVATSGKLWSIREPAKGAAVPEKSIAVLPFLDLSEKHDQAYLADGLAEQLIDLLNKTPDLLITARTSSFYFKGRPTTVAEIGKALNVAYVLEGSVRVAGDKLRITAQLVRADNELHVWSETYNGDRNDIFRIQDEIANALFQSVRWVIRSPLPSQRTTRSWEAYRAYLEGQVIYRGTLRDRAKAVSANRTALAIDDSFAPAWAALALLLAEPEEGQTAVARDAAEKAIKLDPKSAEGYVAKTDVDMYSWDWVDAMQSLATAERLEPGKFSVLRMHSWVAETFGRWGEAIHSAREAVIRDPLSPGVHSQLGYVLYCAGQYEEAVTEQRRSQELSAGEAGEGELGLSLMKLGRLQEALDIAKQEIDDKGRLWSLAIIEDAMGRRADSDREFSEFKRRFPDDDASIAWVYAARGEMNEAFSVLESAYARRDSAIIGLKCMPGVPKFTRDPRYGMLLRKMKLPE